MSEQQSITVNIAGKEYPLKVNTSEVAQIKNAEEVINQKVADIQANYGVKDKQDLLAMSMLQIVVEKNSVGIGEDEGVYEKLSELEDFVSGFLSNK